LAENPQTPDPSEVSTSKADSSTTHQFFKFPKKFAGALFLNPIHIKMAEKTEISLTTSVEVLRLNLGGHGSELTEDGHVRWDKKTPAHPRNWAAWRKAYNTIVILFLELITQVSTWFLLIERCGLTWI
jgi:hypothetical protein